MNVRDSEVIAGILKQEGFRIADAPEKADVILFNTCSVRQHAEDKVWSEIGKYKKKGQIQRMHPALSDRPVRRSPAATVPIIGLIGCMAQEHKEKAFERAPQIDFVVGPSDIDKIPEIVRSLAPGKQGQSPRSGGSPLFRRKIWETDGSARPDEVYHTGYYQDKSRAFVVISEGCSNFCSYCVVPYVRGPLRSRPRQDILKEIRGAVRRGITNATLLGQNVNAYTDPGGRAGFIELLEAVNKVPGLREFSFVTSHPRDTSPELFRAMAGLKKLRKYLHLPVQSGSDRILKLMNRGYGRTFYFDLAAQYRTMVKEGALTTDIIVGFPSETEDDFKDTYDLVKEIGFEAAFIFKYSPRPGTDAAGMDDDVAREEKERRHALVLKLQKKISTSKREKC